VNGAAEADTSKDKLKNISLMSEGIPESGSQIEEVGTARIILIDQIRATKEIHGKQHRLRQAGKSEPQAWADFSVIGPILMQTVHNLSLTMVY
jgi:hypothetical protein